LVILNKVNDVKPHGFPGFSGIEEIAAGSGGSLPQQGEIPYAVFGEIL
jgi:hypothetical protein